MFYRRQLLGVLRTEFQSNQPVTFLVGDFDGSLCEQAVHASARLCKHIRDDSESQADTVCAPYVRCIRACDRPHWSPSTMSAVSLTHCAKIRGFITQDCKNLGRNTRRRVKDRKTNWQQLRLEFLYPLRKNSKPTSKGGRLELSRPAKCSTHICTVFSYHKSRRLLSNQVRRVTLHNGMMRNLGRVFDTFSHNNSSQNHKYQVATVVFAQAHTFTNQKRLRRDNSR